MRYKAVPALNIWKVLTKASNLAPSLSGSLPRGVWLKPAFLWLPPWQEADLALNGRAEAIPPAWQVHGTRLNHRASSKC